MNFPDNIDYGAFYRQAKEKGIKVTSKYAGVSVYKRERDKLEFISTFGAGKSRVNLGRFPFNKHGELMAHRRYMEYRSTLNLKQGRVSNKLVNTPC